MPATSLKNMIYRLALPFSSVRLEKDPPFTAQGSHLYTGEACVRLLRRHHVQQAALLLKDSSHRVVLRCFTGECASLPLQDAYFRVASITKMATALAALSAAGEGLLSLDQPVSEIFHRLPEAPTFPELEGVTLSHLLSHTSGLKDPANLEAALNQGLPLFQVLPGCRASAPGAAFQYSNLGFGIIGSLLEAVYQLPVSQVLDRLVFTPLGMRATLDASTLAPAEIVPITRIPIRPGQKAVSMKVTPLGRIPLTAPAPLLHYGHTAGAMYTDLFSLEKMMDCLQREGSPLIPNGLGKQMRTAHASYGKASPGLSYGLGLLIIQDPTLSASRLLGHQGFAYGCADGAFWEEDTGRMLLFLNGGASEARVGRLGLCNRDMLRWALGKEMAQWKSS